MSSQTIANYIEKNGLTGEEFFKGCEDQYNEIYYNLKHNKLDKDSIDKTLDTFVNMAKYIISDIKKESPELSFDGLKEKFIDKENRLNPINYFNPESHIKTIVRNSRSKKGLPENEEGYLSKCLASQGAHKLSEDVKCEHPNTADDLKLLAYRTMGL